MSARLLVAAFAVLIAGCGSVAGSGGSPSPTPPPGTIMVTRASNQQTVTVHVGGHIQIALGDDIDWRLEPPDGIVLAHPVQTYMLVRGTQAIWLARSAGRATIKATGGQKCASGQPCPLLLAVFAATVEVVP